MHDPRVPHFTALKRILRYIRGIVTHDLLIHVSLSSDLIAYSDADRGDVLSHADPPLVTAFS